MYSRHYYHGIKSYNMLCKTLPACKGFLPAVSL